MFSNFQNSIQRESRSTEQQKIVFIKMEEDDRDPGRFWLKLIASLRIHYPALGKALLDSLVDHHSYPTAGALKVLADEIQGIQIPFILDRVEFIVGQPWWQHTESWLRDFSWMGNDIRTDKSPDTRKHLPFVNPENFSGNDKSNEMLIAKGEWLEEIRWLLVNKDFEEAGDILEQQGENWLQQGFDPLELLFWLREIPSVLLYARPILCWLGAKACHTLELPFLVNYYSNAAEHSLNSLSRFSRNTDEWLTIEINENGVTVGALIDKINLLKP